MDRWVGSFMQTVREATGFNRPKLDTPHRDSLSTEPQPPCGLTREAVLQTLGLKEPATDAEIKAAFQKKAADQLSVWLVDAQNKKVKTRPVTTTKKAEASGVTPGLPAEQRYVELVDKGERMLREEPPDVAAAIESLEQAITLRPDEPKAHMTLAIALQCSDRHLDASQRFLDGMARYPPGSQRWVQACCMAYEERCHVAQPGRPWACEAQPAPPEWMSSPKEVVRMATRLLKVDVEATMAWVMKATAEEAAGQLQEAAGSYMKAAKLCKVSGDAANQDEFAARARDVLGRLKGAK